MNYLFIVIPTYLSNTQLRSCTLPSLCVNLWTSIMASLTPISQSHFLFNKTHLIPTLKSLTYPNLGSDFLLKKSVSFRKMSIRVPMKAAVGIVSATTAEKAKKGYPGESKGFVEEMRFVAMKLHTRDQAKEGEKEVKEPQEGPVAKWEPTGDGYLKFLVDSKLVYGTLEGIVEKAPFPCYSEFRNTGLERSEKLAKDLEWFKEQGYVIPEPCAPGVTYTQYLKELSEVDPQAFLCHFYNIYFAHSAGGRMIGKKVAEMILDKKELQFYKWDGELSQLLKNAREKLNKVAQSWTREEKNHCLEETEKSFKHSGEILRLILS